MGYVGRNSETESDSGAIPDLSATVDCYFAFDVVAVHAVSSKAACRIQNFAETCLHVSPFVCAITKAERQELPCIEPE